MPTQPKAATNGYSRRDFLKRAVLGAAAVTAAALVASKMGAKGKKQGPLPGPGSIFEPRPQDIVRQWRDRLSHLRFW